MQVYKIRIDGQFVTKKLTPTKRGGGKLWVQRKLAEKLVDQYNDQNPPLPGMAPSAEVVAYTLVEIQFT